MEIVSQTIIHDDVVYKITNSRVFTRAFGTTVYNHSMHWNWIEIPPETKLAKAILDLFRKEGR